MRAFETVKKAHLVAGCGNLNIPSTMRAVYSAQRENVTLTCVDGYQRVGAGVLYCDGAEWVGTLPDCLKGNVLVCFCTLHQYIFTNLGRIVVYKKNIIKIKC